MVTVNSTRIALFLAVTWVGFTAWSFLKNEQFVHQASSCIDRPLIGGAFQELRSSVPKSSSFHQTDSTSETTKLLLQLLEHQRQNDKDEINTLKYLRLIQKEQQIKAQAVNDALSKEPEQERSLNNESKLVNQRQQQATDDERNNQVTAPHRWKLKTDPMTNLRFDEAAPTIIRATTHYLSSIPEEHRIPKDGAANMTNYISKEQNIFPANKDRLPLFEMNPSLARLPEEYRRHRISGKYPAYVATYRITRFNNCFSEDTKVQLYAGGNWDTFRKLKKDDLLGFALLDEDMEILVETVVDLTHHMETRAAMRARRGIQGLQFNGWLDFRVFSLPHVPSYMAPSSSLMSSRRISNTGGEFLYFTTQLKILPIYLSIDGSLPPAMTGDPGQWVEGVSPYRQSESQTGGRGTSLKVLFRNYTSCGVYDGIYRNAKNMQYFVDGNDRIMMDYFPGAFPHDIREIDLEAPCQSVPISPKPNGTIPYPDQSFGTIDEGMYPGNWQDIWFEDRGSACCLQIVHPRTKQRYLFGVSHPKTRYPGKNLPPGVAPNTYFSRFFAFSPNPPYDIIARSGVFCLGYPSASLDSNYDDHPHPFVKAQEDPMLFGPPDINETSRSFKCPRLHFVLSIVEDVKDSELLWISYGVGDCLPRMIQIHKDDVQKMLWPNED